MRKFNTALDLLRAGDWPGIHQRIRKNLNLLSPQELTLLAWDSHSVSKNIHWWDVPGMQQRWNKMITGQEETTYFHYVAEKYFSALAPRLALTLGCGTGTREREWARYFTFERHEGIDISPRAIQEATVEASLANLLQLHYKTQDVNYLELSEHTYDVILAEQSLHHVLNMEHVIKQVCAALRPNGLFIMHEFVGPSRFQWTDRQIEVINASLLLLPTKYRRSVTKPGNLKQPIIRPSIKDMMLTDPSEAARSAEIQAIIRKYFQILEWKGFGGALLHMLFYDIVANFSEKKSKDLDLIDMCFTIEDTLMKIGDLPHDFVFAVCTPLSSG